MRRMSFIWTLCTFFSCSCFEFHWKFKTRTPVSRYTANTVTVSMLQNSVSETINMKAPTVGNNSADFVNFHCPSSNRRFISLSSLLITYQHEELDELFVFLDMGLVIFGTIGNMMTLAALRMYQRSSKSSAIFLLQALCVVETCYLLCCVCCKTSVISLYVNYHR